MTTVAGACFRFRLRRAVAAAATVALCAGSLLTAGGATAAAAAADTSSPYAVSAQISLGTDSLSTAVAVDLSNHNVYVGSNPFAGTGDANTLPPGTISVIDESGDVHSGQVTALINVAGKHPDPEVSALAVDSSNHNVYVADENSGTVSVIDESGDARRGQVTRVITVPVLGDGLGEIVVDPSNHNVYVGIFGGVAVIDESGDARSGQVTATFPGEGPVAVDPSNHNVYFTDGDLEVLDESGDARSGQVTGRLNVPGLFKVAVVDPSNHNLYVIRDMPNSCSGCNYEVSAIDESGDAHDGQIISNADIGSPTPVGVAIDPSTHDLYITDLYGVVTVIDESGKANTGRVKGILHVSNLSAVVAVDPSNHNAYMPVYYSNHSTSLAVINASGAIGGVIGDSTSQAGLANACIDVEEADTGIRVESLQANLAGVYAGTITPGSYKLLASDCLGGTYATTYYGGADNYDFLSPHAQTVTVTAGSTQRNLNVSLPLAGTIQGTVTDTTSRQGITGICAYAIDTTQNMLRGSSGTTTATGRYSIGDLPPGTDRVAFQSCAIGPYSLTYSLPVTVIAAGTVTLNDSLVHS